MDRLAIRAERDEPRDAGRARPPDMLGERLQVQRLVLVEEGWQWRVDAAECERARHLAAPAAVRASRLRVRPFAVAWLGRERMAGSLPTMARKRIAWRIRW